MKEWYYSRTIWIAIITGALGIVMAFQSEYPTVGGIMFAKAALDIVLRFATDSRIK